MHIYNLKPVAKVRREQRYPSGVTNTDTVKYKVTELNARNKDISKYVKHKINLVFIRLKFPDDLIKKVNYHLAALTEFKKVSIA